MRLVITAIFLFLQPGLAGATPTCFSFAAILCECSAVFDVLERKAAGSEEAELNNWRRLSKQLRAQSYQVMGKDLGDQMIDAQIGELLDASNSLEATLGFAQMLSRCSVFLGDSKSIPEVVVGP